MGVPGPPWPHCRADSAQIWLHPFQLPPGDSGVRIFSTQRFNDLWKERNLERCNIDFSSLSAVENVASGKWINLTECQNAWARHLCSTCSEDTDWFRNAGIPHLGSVTILWSLITSDLLKMMTINSKIKHFKGSQVRFFPSTTNIKWSKDDCFQRFKLYETLPAVAASSVSAPSWILATEEVIQEMVLLNF